MLRRFDEDHGHADLQMPIIVTMHHPETGIVRFESKDQIRERIDCVRVTVERIDSIVDDVLLRRLVEITIRSLTRGEQPRMMTMQVKWMRRIINIIHDHIDDVSTFDMRIDRCVEFSGLAVENCCQQRGVRRMNEGDIIEIESRWSAVLELTVEDECFRCWTGRDLILGRIDRY